MPQGRIILKPGIDFAQLDAWPSAMSDNVDSRAHERSAFGALHNLFNRSKTAA